MGQYSKTYYEDKKITEVTDAGDWYSIAIGSSCFGIQKSRCGDVVPKIGDDITIGITNGSTIRAIDINGKELYFLTDQDLDNEHKAWVDKRNKEKEEEFKKNKDKLDADYESLPNVFKMRFDRFRDGNPDFRRDYESYEMMVCKEAIKIAEHCGTADKVQEFSKSEERFTIMDSGHSNNSAGISLRLAWLYLNRPELVPLEHGAMVYLVGCEAYGCTHDTK